MNEQEFDYIISGGSIYDGSGASPIRADIAVRGDKIEAIEADGAGIWKAGKVIDATGLAVAPGFIDIHTHSDMSILNNPMMESSIHQGVTTEVMGNCGISVGVITSDEIFAQELRWLEGSGVKIGWNRFGGFLSRIDELGTAINVCSLAGHGTIRKRIMGEEPGPPTCAQIAQLLTLTDQCMNDGAVGLSTGLEYLPGRYATVDEIAPLAAVAKKSKGIYTSHIRNEGDTLLESIAEAIEVGERTGIPVQVSHIKAEGRRNWGKVAAALDLIESARAQGIDVQTDTYPYIAYMTGLSVFLLPRWASAGTNDEMTARLNDPQTRQRIRKEILENPPQWDKVLIGGAPKSTSAQGKTLAELAVIEGKDPVDTALDLLAFENGWLSAAHFAQCDEDLEKALEYRYTSIGSDGVSACPHGKFSDASIHPRSYGCFPRVLGIYVREKGVLSLPEAIRRMTSLPAKRVGIANRGELAPGAFADIVAFRPETVIDLATFGNPHQFAKGIELVLVNGQIALENGEQRDIRAGKALRRTNGVVE
jgi:N-acyl-D-amino-acid deacylase